MREREKREKERVRMKERERERLATEKKVKKAFTPLSVQGLVKKLLLPLSIIIGVTGMATLCGREISSTCSKLYKSSLT